MRYSADRIRNVALVGHRGAGKTSLHEALLYEGGAIDRLGSVTEGGTSSDSDPDEQARQMSISAALHSFDWAGRKINLIDTPGDPSFVADALGGLRVCESAVFVVNGVMGPEVSTQRLWRRAAELDLARMIYVNMLDRERADFYRTLDALKAAFGRHVVATEIPLGSEHEIAGVVDLVDMKCYRYPDAARGSAVEAPIPDDLMAQALEYRENLMDEVAEVSDALMERYLEGDEISHQEIVDALKDGTNHGSIFPVVCGVATRNLGTNRLLDAIVEDLPSPVKHGGARAAGGDPRAGRGPRAVRLRLQDPSRHVRRPDQSVPRLPGGHAPRHAALNTRTHTKERIGQLTVFAGRETRRTSTSSARATSARSPSSRRRGPATGWPAATSRSRCRRSSSRRPVMAFAIEPQTKGDEDKVFTLAAAPPGGGPDDRPPPRPANRRADRRGLSQIHVEVIVDRLRSRFGAEVDAEAAARALPGDDPPAGARHTAGTRSSRAAAASSATATSRSSRSTPGGGLRVRRPDQGRRDPELVHPGRREGRPRGDGHGRPRPGTRSRMCG